MKKIFLILIAVSCQLVSCDRTGRPKLVVGVVIDQMRAEYLYRFQNNYSENGFKKLLHEGFNVKNVHYNYVPTYTGPGHASIYTGTTPTNHGIVSNDWYSRKLGENVYCAQDDDVFLVDVSGIKNEVNQFSRSPKNLLATTITDELKLFTNGRSKVIGLSIKDRGAILPTGHMADAAYWYNSNNGNFVTSSYYKNELPEWLKKFNGEKKADSLLNLIWKPLFPIENYTNSQEDDAPFEKIFMGKNQSIFPYNLKELRRENNDFALLAEVPQGNTLLTELVIATIDGENLGKSNVTDFLTISYSSTDYVGHHFGIRSKELEDTYVRLDREIAKLLNVLDQKVGKNNYILFLTADHAATDNPVFLKSKKLPGGFINTKEIKDSLENHLENKFGADNYIAFIDKTQIYFHDTKTNKELVIKEALKFLKDINGVKEVFAFSISKTNISSSTIGNYVKNAYTYNISGDIIYHCYSGWMDKIDFGTSHGNAYTNDTHVPLLWLGCNIPRGQTIKPKNITQIAPTLSLLLDIPLTSASDKSPIEELFLK